MSLRPMVATTLVLLACGAGCVPPEPEPPPAWVPLFWMDPMTGCHYWRETNLPRYYVDQSGRVTIYCTDEDGAVVTPGDREVPKALPRKKSAKTASYASWTLFSEPLAGASVRVKL